MKSKTTQTCIRTIKPGDSKWLIEDGSVIVPRAGFEIDPKCPKDYRQIIVMALQYNWLMPVANVKDSELFWEAMQ